MRFGIMYKQREIIIVPFPFSDLSSIKQRPAVIVSSNDFNENEDLVVVAITSQIKISGKFRVNFSNNDLDNGSIPKESQIRCDKIYTLNKSLVRKRIAKLSEKTFAEVLRKIENIYK